MEYGKRNPLASAPSPEQTAITMKSIHDILAETGSEGWLQPAPKPAATQPRIQQPPSAAAFIENDTAPSQPVATSTSERASPRHPELRPAKTERPQKQGLGQRLTQRLFGRG